MDMSYIYKLLKKFFKNRLPYLVVIIAFISFFLYLRFWFDLNRGINAIFEFVLILLILMLGSYLNTMAKSIRRLRRTEEISSIASVQFYKKLRPRRIVTHFNFLRKEFRKIAPYFLDDIESIEKEIRITRHAIEKTVHHIFRPSNIVKTIFFILFIVVISIVLKEGNKNLLNFYFLIFVFTLFGGILTSMVGFASKFMVISILLFFIDIKTAIALTAAYSIILYSTTSYLYRDKINKPLLISNLAWLIMGLVIGLFIFKFINLSYLKIVFSIFILTFVFYKISKIDLGIKINDKILSYLLFVYGIVAASMGAAGPLLAVFLFQFGLKKARFIGYASAVLLITGIITTIGYIIMGFIQLNEIVLLTVLSLSAIGSAILGRRLVQIIPVKSYDLLLLFVLFALGVKGLIF